MQEGKEKVKYVKKRNKTGSERGIEELSIFFLLSLSLSEQVEEKRRGGEEPEAVVQKD